MKKFYQPTLSVIEFAIMYAVVTFAGYMIYCSVTGL